MSLNGHLLNKIYQMPNKEIQEALKPLMPYLYKMIWIIPILLIPAAIVIYYTDPSANLIQMFSIIGFALVLFLILKGLLIFTEKQLNK